MSRSWFDRLLKPARDATRPSSPELQVRKLEQRRVLDASGLSILVTPTTTGEGDTVTVSADAGSIATPQFDWTVTVDAVVIETSNSSLFEFTPADDGVYTIDLQVTDGSGTQYNSSTDLTVTNVDPQLTPSANVSVDEGSLLYIADLGRITDPGFRDTTAGTVETFSYSIDWGDGTTIDTGTAKIDQVGSEGTPTLASFDGKHYYADNGVYTVTLSVVDDDGGVSNTATLQITVGNLSPELTVVGNQSAYQGQTLSITDLGTLIDRGFDNTALGTSETFTYSIDWGDGTPADTGNATIDQVGSIGVRTTASMDGSHVYASEGVYDVTVTVMDDDGGVDDGTFQVEVINADPTLTVVGDQTADEGTPLSITNIGQISDLVFLPDAGDEFTYTINWGDGTAADTGTATVDQPNAPGTATLASFDGTHTYADNGTYTVTITIDDGDGGTDSGTFDVEVANVTPTLNVSPDVTIDEGATLTLTDIGIITDPGYDNSSTSTEETFTYSINWGDGSAVDTGSATVDQIGTDGTPTLASFDGSHTYADNGVYTVTVTVADDDGGTLSKTFEVTVLNVAPTLNVSPDVTIDEGATLTLTDIGIISDPGYDNSSTSTEETFTYSINWGDGSIADSGSATIDQIGSDGLPTLASLDGTHTYADNGVYTVTVTVADDDGGTLSKTFEVTVLNVAPTLNVSPDVTIDEGATLMLTDIGIITDPGYDNSSAATEETFTYSINWGDGSTADTGSATVDQVGSDGLPTLASFDGSHTYADNGVYTVTVSVADDDGGTLSKTFEVTVLNVAPTLNVSPDVTIDEGATLTLTDIGIITDPGYDNAALGSSETFTYSINWGDFPIGIASTATIDQVGSEGSPTLASFDGSHTYADNGVYTVTVTVTDDDGGTITKTFEVTVLNVAPQLTGVDGTLTLDEGQEFTLSDLGVGLSDPGFDNIYYSSNGVVDFVQILSSETFTAAEIDWGDGTATTMVDIVDRVSGSEGILTTANFDHAAHAYADNGTYTVTVSFTDDDGGAVDQSFDITVNNVAPTLTLTDEAFTINEGDTLNIPLLGSFTDPGYNNAANPNGASEETFTYSIDWGDGSAVETGVLPSSTTDGGQGVLTTGTLANSHLYADNDVDNTYTITVTLADDDGGTHTQSFDVTVLNVAPTLESIAATDINSGGWTTLTLTFSDPGADQFEILVAWGENQDQPLSDRWIIEATYDGATPETFVISYQYQGPPNPTNISADVPINVVIRDDDFATGAITLELGQSNIETVMIGQPGTDDAKFAIDITSDIPVVEFPQRDEAATVEQGSASNVQLHETQDVRSRGGEASASSERYFRLHVVMPDGAMLEGIRLSDGAMDDLPALFARLPDNHYRIYLIRSENQSPRMVLDVVVRDHRPIDPADASDGTRDKPPVEVAPQQGSDIAPPAAAATPTSQTPATPAATLDATTDEVVDSSPTPTPQTPRQAAAASALAAAALVLDPKTDWAVRLDQEFARADHRRWQQLRRRRPR